MKKKTEPKDSSEGNGERSKSKKDFLVVGLGASAGGVKALQEFFATMPPDSGMAFVAILHLSPEHESSLAQILQAQTAMKVTQVTKTVKVEPNNVYVIPPNVQLEMIDGVIRPVKAERPTGHRIAIDVFFRTLAEAYERNAVCIVLSGTGSDGTLGLKRVKESNGFAIVQDPEDAEYDSMPRSAINTHLADWVLPVHKMPEKLINFRESSEKLHLTNGADAKRIAEEIHADESLREILTLLRVRTGHDFSNYKTPTLIRRIARHLQIHELTDIPSYIELLRNTPNEIQSLFKNLLINVTNFYRDKNSFEVLEKQVVPKLFEGKTGKNTVRVWSCGCASGEEAYSLAIMLSEYAGTLADPPKIQIFATDVDEDAIQEAREHRYPESIEADVSPERLKKFFVKEDTFYRVKKELREIVLFASHNVLRDPPFSRLDLIACRNLLIYLNRETQERVLQIFHFALAADGYLFLGSSETAENVTTLYATVDKKNRIYERRTAPTAQSTLPVMPVVGRWEVRIPERKTGRSSDRAPTLSEIHYKLLENYAPSSVLINQDFDIVYLSGTAGKFLRFSGGEPSRNLLKAINPDLLPDLRAALFTAQREHKSSEFPNIRIVIDGVERFINLIVRAVDVKDEAREFLLVIFEERNSPASLQEADREIQKITNKDEAMESVVRRLEEDLQRTKEHLRFTIEQHETSIEELKASNEELQAINEELRSASEELETSKEELQSVNEEMTTVNHELKEKIEETSRINSDLSNLMAATDIATIFLDKNLQIKSFTPPVEEFFNITKSDIGRPLAHFTHKLNYDDLAKDAAQVLKNLAPREREITDKKNRNFLARFASYRTVDDRIDGVVLNFINITGRKTAENAVRRSEEKFITFVTATADILYEMSADWRELQFLNGKEFVVSTEEPREDWMDAYIPDAEKPRVRAAIDRAVETKSIFELDHRIVRLDGSVGWAFSRAVPIIGADGEIVRWFGAASDITDRKQGEQSLRESEEKFRTLFDSMDEGFCLIQVVFDSKQKPIDYRFIETNPAFYAQTGFEDDVIGRTMMEVAPGLEKFWFDTYGRIALTGEAMRFEHQADVLNRWYDVFAFRVGEPEERKVAVIFSDIAERIKTAELVRESEERLRIAVEAAEMGTWDWDLTTDEAVWNERHFLLFGMKPRKTPVPSSEFFEHIHPDDRERVTQLLRQAVKKKTTFEAEFCIVREDGQTRWMQGYGHAVEVVKGKTVRMSGVMSDITFRKNAAEALRKSEEQLQLILESTKDYSIITFDLEGFITRWNMGAEKIFGYTEAEMIGKKGDILFTPEDRAAKVPAREFEVALAKGRAEDERWHVRKDGSRFFASGVMQPLRNGKLEGYVKIARDQTERLKTETALREQEMLRQFVRTQEDERRRIARDIHDQLGQQLTALRLKIVNLKKTCAKMDVPGKEHAAAQIDELQKTGEQIDRDVDFLAWELRPASLEDLGLRLTLQNFVKEWASYTGIKADFQTTGLGKSHLTDEIETNLYRIAQETLNNILKHARATNVSVILEKRKDRIVLIVEDNGVGFNVNVKPKSARGLGLLGMSERAKILGGEFEIESVKNSGTTVFVRVPVKSIK